MRVLEELPFLELADPRVAQDSVAVLKEAAELSPLVRTPGGVTVVDGRLHEPLARDRRLLDDHAGNLVEIVGLTPGGPAARFRTEMLLNQHGKEHALLRSTVSGYFSPIGVQALLADIQEIVADLLAECPADEPIQFMDAVASRIPARLFCRMVSIPESEAPFVTRISDAVLQIFAGDPSSAPSIETAYDELFTYVAKLIAERRSSVLGDDLLSQVIQAQDNGRMTEQQVYDMVVMLLEASTDNTSNQLAMAAADLVSHPGQFRYLQAHPEKAKDAANECIRFRPRVLRLRRTAVEDYTIDDIQIPAGTVLVMPVYASHYNGELYPNPERFDLTREHVRPMTTFGGGAHACIGSALATLEIQELVGALARHYPDAALAGALEVENNGEVQFVTSLPIVLGQRANAPGQA